MFIEMENKQRNLYVSDLFLHVHAYVYFELGT